MDVKREAEFFKFIEASRQGKTTIVITHSVRHASKAQRILFFEDGHLIEDGSHEELMKKEGSYWQFYITK